MKTCVYCEEKFTKERPYDHCMKRECVESWMIQRRRNMAINLIPKSGFQVVYRNT